MMGAGLFGGSRVGCSEMYGDGFVTGVGKRGLVSGIG